MSKQKRGKLIAVDGIAGAGKTSLMAFLATQQDLNLTLFTGEPGGTEIAEAIGGLVLSMDYQEDMDAITQLMLMCAMRRQHMAKVIIPAIEAGENVIMDGFRLSTYAYQVCGPDRKDLWAMFVHMDAMARGAVHDGAHLVGGMLLDLQIVLDVDSGVGLARAASRIGKMNSFDLKDLDFCVRVRNGFLDARNKDNTVIIDTSKSQSEVQQEALILIKKTLDA